MSIPLLRGRSFTPQDRLDAPRVVIVDQNMAEGYWPGQNPIGQRIRIEVGEPFVAEVVGVVGNVRQVSLRDEPIQTLYMPYLQDQWQDMTIVVRGRGELGPVIREEAVRIDREQPVILASLDSILARALARPRFNMLLLCTFAGLGLLLAMIGLYGVVSFSVSQRSRELGIRIALGAQKTDNMSLVLREGLRLALVGLGLGLVGAVLASRTVTSQLFGVQPTDPMTYFTAALLLLLVALLACFVPARRAARVSSVTVMQSEP
jgi:putative ABC transport system permease protein